MRQCRSPRGERGLKYYSNGLLFRKQRSLPSRGAWIEMVMLPTLMPFANGRSPRGERGLKYPVIESRGKEVSRSPRGERGLKLLLLREYHEWLQVAPLAGSVD